MAAPQNDLDVLGIANYAMAGLAAFFGLFPSIYVAMGVAMLAGSFGGAGGQPPPEILGWFMIAFGGVFLLATLAYAALLVLAGRYLRSRRHWTYCLVMAALSCAFFPFGTLLGVFTILVLARPEARALFGAAGPAAWSGTGATAPPPPSSPPAGG